MKTFASVPTIAFAILGLSAPRRLGGLADFGIIRTDGFGKILDCNNAG